MNAIEKLLLHDKVDIIINQYKNNRFYIDDYIDKNKSEYICMHCKTEKEANKFLMYLDNIGRTWSNGNSYLGNNYFYKNEENTVYFFLDGKYGDVAYAKSNNVKILEFDDFNWD